LIKRFYILFLIIICASCSYFKPKAKGDTVARVNNVFLYKEDIKTVLPNNLSKEDSTIFVNNFINKWANEQLLVQGAKVNLSTNKQDNFNALVEQYKNDLYSKAYLEALVYKNLDTLVGNEEALSYYQENKEAFKLNEDLIKFRYINLDENRLDLKDVKDKFKRYSLEDKKELDSISIQFKSYSLNDSVWIRLDQVVNKIPVINSENKIELLKKTNFIQLKDSLGLYLMQINDVLPRNSKVRAYKAIRKGYYKRCN